jgi:hypothetical protein
LGVPSLIIWMPESRPCSAWVGVCTGWFTISVPYTRATAPVRSRFFWVP